MGRNQGLSNLFRGQQGVTMILVAIVILVIIGFAALAIDIGHLFVVRNELKNAADAGALAGARVLLNADGSVNTGANAVAQAAATANRSEKLVVEVNPSDVRRGHWSFATETFTANETQLDPIPLWNVSNAELDANPNFINAIWVQTWRQQSPALSFFARILGFFGFVVRDESVAYIGFAGTLEPEEVDQPIAICMQSITEYNDEYTCSTGRMIDSGGGTTHNSGAWTNLEQPCETASVPTVRPLVCGDGNPLTINLGGTIGTTGGMQNVVYEDLRDCWRNGSGLATDGRGYPIEFWKLTLPVIDCPANNPGPCSDTLGAVTLNVLWIKQSGTDPDWWDIPLVMEDWSCSLGTNINDLTETQRQGCWQEFSTHFHLETADGTSAGDLTPNQLQKTIFFLPDCNVHEPAGQTGGKNFGIMAKIPVLVQ